MFRDPSLRSAILGLLLASGVATFVVALVAAATLAAAGESARQTVHVDGAISALLWTAVLVWAATALPGTFLLVLFWSRAAALRLALHEPKAVFPRNLTGALGDIALKAEALQEQVRTLERERGRERGAAGAILESMTEAVLAVDPDLRVVATNAAAAKLLGFDPASATGQPLGGIMRLEEAAEAAERAVGGKGGTTRVELPGPPPKVLELEAEPFRGGDGAVLVLRDVTESARFADMRRDFVASASHELRTPLSVIRSTVETLLEPGMSPEQGRSFLEAVARQAKTLEALVNDLLDLGKLESRPEFTPRATDIAEVLRRVAEAHGAAAKAKGVSLDVDAPAGLPRLMADAGLLERAFANLADNALRYTPAGGRVVMKADAEAEGVRVEVKDTGIGIPQADLKRIFERFYRVDKSRSRDAGGTGLGLAIVKHVVGLHKGEVWAESDLGKGATFIVRLPGFG